MQDSILPFVYDPENHSRKHQSNIVCRQRIFLYNSLKPNLFYFMSLFTQITKSGSGQKRLSEKKINADSRIPTLLEIAGRLHC